MDDRSPGHATCCLGPPRQQHPTRTRCQAIASAERTPRSARKAALAPTQEISYPTSHLGFTKTSLTSTVRTEPAAHRRPCFRSVSHQGTGTTGGKDLHGAQHLHGDRHVGGDYSRSDLGNGDRRGHVHGVGGGPASDLRPERGPGCRLPLGPPSAFHSLPDRADGVLGSCGPGP